MRTFTTKERLNLISRATTHQLQRIDQVLAGEVMAGQGSDPADVMLTKLGMAERMHMTVRSVENWQHRGLLPYLKLDKVVLFYWPDVVEHLKRNYRVCKAPCPGPCRTGDEGGTR